MDTEGTPIPCQADDVDKDGQWDELFAIVNLAPSAQEQLTLSFINPVDYPHFESRTNLRLGAADRPGYPELTKAERIYDNDLNKAGTVFQMFGPAWENDKVGFRNYMDQRNGIDIFGKLVHEMVLDSVGIAGSPNYHELAT